MLERSKWKNSAGGARSALANGQAEVTCRQPGHVGKPGSLDHDEQPTVNTWLLEGGAAWLRAVTLACAGRLASHRGEKQACSAPPEKHHGGAGQESSCPQTKTSQSSVGNTF